MIPLFALAAVVPLFALGAVPLLSDDTAWIQLINQQALEAAKTHQGDARQVIDTTSASIQADEGMRCPAQPYGSKTGKANHIKTISNLNQQQGEARYPQLMVFVSFSMPLATLKNLGRQLDQVGGKMVFRGLVNNSFKEMSLKLQELGHEALIDPTLFTALNVQQVPTVVHFAQQPTSVDQLPPFDQLQGNVSLSYALQQFVTKGDVAGAQHFLNKLEGGQ